MRLTTLVSSQWALKYKVTRRPRFVTEMDAVVPWARLPAVVEPHCPKAPQGRPPPLRRILRIDVVQLWLNPSDLDFARRLPSPQVGGHVR